MSFFATSGLTFGLLTALVIFLADTTALDVVGVVAVPVDLLEKMDRRCNAEALALMSSAAAITYEYNEYQK